MTEHLDQQRQARTFLTRMEPEYDGVLLHVLECAECRGLARQLLASRGKRAASVPPEGAPPPARLRGPEDETLWRLERLLATPPVLRSRLLREEEFRDLDLASLLLERAEAAQPHAPRRSEELARLAFGIAEPMVADPWVGKANDVKARACVLVGNVRRLERDTEEAEEMFSKAVFHLTGPPNCRQRAFYCRNLALLREDLGQVDEAAGLLWRAALIYRETGEPREEGSCLAQLGLLFLEEEQIERAMPPLTRACQALEPPADAVPYVRCALALSYCHAALNESEKSRRFLHAARALYPHLPEGEPRARAAWFEGKVAALTGVPAEAVERLDEARRDPILVLGYWPPELNGTVTLDGSRFDPSLASTTTALVAHHLANQLSGANDGPDLPKGDAVWK